MSSGLRPRQAADRRPLDFLRDSPHRLKISRRTIRKSSFNDIDAQARQLLGDHDLFFDIHAGPWRLLAIPQRRIEDPNHPVSCRSPLLGSALLKTDVQPGRRRTERTCGVRRECVQAENDAGGCFSSLQKKKPPPPPRDEGLRSSVVPP